MRLTLLIGFGEAGLSSNFEKRIPKEISSSCVFSKFTDNLNVLKDCLKECLAHLKQLADKPAMLVILSSHAIGTVDFGLFDEASLSLLSLICAVDERFQNCGHVWYSDSRLDKAALETISPKLIHAPLSSLPSSGWLISVLSATAFDPFFLYRISESQALSAMSKRLVAPYFDEDYDPIPIEFENFPSLKAQIPLSDIDGLVLKASIFDRFCFAYLDIAKRSIHLIKSEYSSLVEYIASLFPLHYPAASAYKEAGALNSFDNGSAPDSCENTKKTNKENLKKLILLSLRGIGVKKSDRRFSATWKHLYCGCIFSLRKELSKVDLEQDVLIKTIKDNMKFLNITTH